jgi:hypothetical protein
METATALVGADSAVKLNAEAAVYLNTAVVVNPSNAELDEAFGFNDTVHNARLNEVGTLFDNGSERFENLAYRLKEFFFAGVTFFNLSVKILKILIVDHNYIPPKLAYYFE